MEQHHEQPGGGGYPAGLAELAEPAEPARPCSITGALAAQPGEHAALPRVLPEQVYGLLYASED